MDGDGHHYRDPERSEAAFGRNPERADADRQVEVAYRRFGAYIFRHVLMICLNRDDAWDVVQQTFFVFTQYLRRGKTCEQPRAFLARTATRLSLRAMRGWFWRRRPLETLAEDALVAPAIPHELLDAIGKILPRLTPKERAVLKALLWDELTISETAEHLGFSKISIRRALRSIIKRLERQGISAKKNLIRSGGLDASIR